MQSPLSVSELTHLIQNTLHQEPALENVWVTGEASNISTSARGHLYFVLKDREAQLRCVRFGYGARGKSFVPNEGDQILCNGEIRVYPLNGVYQLYVSLIEPIGLGLMFQQLEELRRRLEMEGLFAEEKKRSLPLYAQRIGVVTSPTGAVIHDIISILQRRWPIAELILSPCQVQGVDAADSVRHALDLLRHFFPLDAVIIARGGGSLEDLWPFNDEQLVRAVRAFPVPIVSAIGHQTDFTLVDFAADLRVPTPTAAAESVSPDRSEEDERLSVILNTLQLTLRSYFLRCQSAVDTLERQLKYFSPQQAIQRAEQRLDELESMEERFISSWLRYEQERLHQIAARLTVLSPQRTLERGYAIVQHAATKRIVIDAADVTPGDLLDVNVAQGTFAAQVITPENHEHQEEDQHHEHTRLRGTAQL